MQQCFNDIIMTPTEDARSTYECIVASDGPIRTLQILINGIIQQSFGYLPPTLVLALENGQCSFLVSLRSLCLTLVAALTRRNTKIQTSVLTSRRTRPRRRSCRRRCNKRSTLLRPDPSSRRASSRSRTASTRPSCPVRARRANSRTSARR